MKRMESLFAAAIALTASLSGAAGAGDARSVADRRGFADALFDRGHYEKAAREYRALIDSADGLKDADTCYFRLAEAENLAGHKEAALVAYGAVLSIPNSKFHEDALFKRAALFTELGMDVAAEELFRVLLSENPGPGVRELALYHHAAALEGIDRAKDAIPDLEALLAEFPNGAMAPYARLSLARILSIPGDKFDPAKAVSLLKPVVEKPLDPEIGAEALFLSAKAQSQAGKFSEAASCFRNLFSSYPDSPRVADARLEADWAFFRAGMPQDMVSCADAALNAVPPPSEGEAVEFRFIRASGLFDLSRLDEACAAFKALAADPAASRSGFASRASYQAAMCRFKQGQTALVEQELRAALANTQTRPDALWLLAEASASTEGRTDAAVQNYRVFIRENPNDPKAPDALYRLGGILRSRSAWSDAAAVYRELAETYPTSNLAPSARFNAADCIDATGQDQAALAEWQTYLRDCPNAPGVPEALFRKAASLMRLDRNTEALAALDELLRRFPNVSRRAAALFYRGSILHKNGAAKDAIAAFSSALESNPPDDVRTDASFQLAMALLETGDEKKAADILASLIDQSKTGRFTPSQLAWLAEWQISSGDNEKAATTARNLAQSDASEEWRQVGWTLLGRALNGAGNAREAEEAYAKACEIPVFTESAAEALLRLGDLLLARGAAEEADKRYREASLKFSSPELEPLRMHAYIGLGKAALALGNKQDAADYFHTVALLYYDPETLPPLLQEASALMDEIGDEEGAADIQEALKYYQTEEK